MKTAVLDFLKSNTEKSAENFNAGYQLLLKTPNVNSAMLRNYNVRGYTPQSLETLHYDLKKLHGISDADVRNHTVAEVAPEIATHVVRSLVEVHRCQVYAGVGVGVRVMSF